MRSQRARDAAQLQREDEVMRAGMMSTRRLTSLLLAGVIALFLALNVSMPSAVAQTESSVVKMPLVKGDSLQVRFEEDFDCGDLLDGVVPRAVVAADKVISGVVLVEEGTPVTVSVPADGVKDNGRAGKPGRLAVEFRNVTAVDERDVPLARGLSKKGSGRGIILKVLTLFLIKGEEPSVKAGDVFWAHIEETTYIYAETK